MPYDLTADPFVTISKAIVLTAQRLRDDEDNLRGIVEAISLSVTICDRDLTYHWLTTESARFLGLRPEQLIGQPIAKVIGWEAFEALAPYFERVLAGEYVEYEERIFFKGPGWRWFRAVYVPMIGSDRVVNGWVALVEMHGGEVSVSSDGPGKGCTFVVSLPVISETKASEAAQPAAEPTAGLRVILIEDNDDVRETVTELLQITGHVVESASDGPEGLECALKRCLRWC